MSIYVCFLGNYGDLHGNMMVNPGPRRGKRFPNRKTQSLSRALTLYIDHGLMSTIVGWCWRITLIQNHAENGKVTTKIQYKNPVKRLTRIFCDNWSWCWHLFDSIGSADGSVYLKTDLNWNADSCLLYSMIAIRNPEKWDPIKRWI